MSIDWYDAYKRDLNHLKYIENNIICTCSKYNEAVCAKHNAVKDQINTLYHTCDIMLARNIHD